MYADSDYRYVRIQMNAYKIICKFNKYWYISID